MPRFRGFTGLTITVRTDAESGVGSRRVHGCTSGEVRWRRFRDRLKERPLLFLLLHPLLDEIAVVHQFADQGIDLL